MTFKQHIINSYSKLVHKQTKKLQKNKIQSSSAKNRMIFLTRCLVNKIIPKSFNKCPVVRNAKARRITFEYCLQMIRVARDEAKQRYHILLKQIDQLSTTLKQTLSTSDFHDLQRITEVSREKSFIAERERLRDKFNSISGHERDATIGNNIVKSAVLNLATDGELTKNQIELLDLGPKFVPAFKTAPIMDIITSVEAVASTMNGSIEEVSDSENLRHDVSNILLKYAGKRLPSNLTRQQNDSLKELQQNTEIKVVPFDKGTGFVVLKSEDMFQKIKDQLGEAKEIQKDPTQSLTKKFQSVISSLKKEQKIDKKLFYSMYPSDPIPPRLYGLIKAHKPSKNYPMRTVVSTIGTPFYGTSSFLVQLIQPTLNKNNIRVKNSSSFVEEAKTWTIAPNEKQVSFDVIALYPSVNVKLAIEAIMRLLQNDEVDVSLRTKLSMNDIRKLLEVSLSICYFVWDNKFYKIDDAGPIGLSLMVVVAEGYLQFLESKAIQIAINTNVAPKTYLRYVDDSHARFADENQIEEFREILNSQDPKIQYTVEHEENGSLPFLDVNVINNGGGAYEFQVYRKDAITNLMIKPNSSVEPNMYKGVFKGFLARAVRICSAQYLQQEVDLLVEIFKENGYEEKELRRLSDEYLSRRDRVNSTTARDEQCKRYVKMPFVPGLGPKIRKVLKKRGIKTFFTAAPSLKDILCRHKTTLPPNSYPGVYSVSCECGTKYIGESKKKISTRMKQHERDIFHGRWKNSGISEHASRCQKNVIFEDVKTITYESDWRRRKIREALEIRKARRGGQAVANQDEGTVCTTTAWNVLLSRLTSK